MTDEELDQIENLNHKFLFEILELEAIRVKDAEPQDQEELARTILQESELLRSAIDKGYTKVGYYPDDYGRYHWVKKEGGQWLPYFYTNLYPPQIEGQKTI